MLLVLFYRLWLLVKICAVQELVKPDSIFYRIMNSLNLKTTVFCNEIEQTAWCLTGSNSLHG